MNRILPPDYSVELTDGEQRLLTALCEEGAKDPDIHAEPARQAWRNLAAKLRNAQPVQPSALSRLEEWKLAANDITDKAGNLKRRVFRGSGATHRGYEVELVELTLYGDAPFAMPDKSFRGGGDTLADAINAALDAVEGEA